MEIQIDVGFDQLIKIVKTLPPVQLKQLKAEIDKENLQQQLKTDLETLLLNGPTATKRELRIIRKNRKGINQWRTS